MCCIPGGQGHVPNSGFVGPLTHPSQLKKGFVFCKFMIIIILTELCCHTLTTGSTGCQNVWTMYRRHHLHTWLGIQLECWWTCHGLLCCSLIAHKQLPGKEHSNIQNEDPWDSTSKSEQDPANAEAVKASKKMNNCFDLIVKTVTN